MKWLHGLSARDVAPPPKIPSDSARGIGPCPPDLAKRTLATIDAMKAESDAYIASLKPDSYTWAEFKRSWDIACVDAYEANPLNPNPTISLPWCVFPHVTAVENQCTGQMVKIRRYSWTPFGKPRECGAAHYPGGDASHGVNKDGMACVLAVDHTGSHRFERPCRMDDWRRK